jgi:RNA polymerase sigma-70 factor (ECF subfamily)
MGDSEGQTVLQRLLEQLGPADEATFARARDRLLEHANGQLEKLAHAMLRRYPRLRRWEQTGDVLQNAALRLHRALTQVRPASVRDFFALAATQIRRELIDLTRHHFGPLGDAAHHDTDPGAEAGDGFVDNARACGGEPSTLLDWADFHEKVERLPAAEREALDLLWYEGLTQKEAAAVLGVTEKTVKNRWRRAKLLLQELLTDGDARAAP